MLRSNADFGLGLKYVRVIPYNDDNTIPLPTAVNEFGRGALIGGAGPFDFSGVESDGSIVIYAKVDNGDTETKHVDLSGAADISAVTVSELEAALTAASITGATFDTTEAPDPNVGRIKCTFASGSYWQLWGECAEIAMFGQGLGVKYAVADTEKSLTDDPINKDEQTFTTTDANNIDTEVLTDGYRKGWSGVLTDSADDLWLRCIIEGGTLDANGVYLTPTSASTKKYFLIEAFYKKFGAGLNKEADFKGYVKKTFNSCKGAMGSRTHEAGFSDVIYNITGTSYKDENGVLNADQIIEPLTITEFLALDIGNTSAY